MSLDVVKNLELIEKIENIESQISESIDDFVESPFSKWHNFPISRIAHHGKACCEASREWLTSMDYSQLNAGSKLSGPRWIPQRYVWGPTKWPIHWCEALDLKSLDCGAQSAIADEIFKARGVRSYQVQLVQEFSKEATRQWTERWKADEASIFWIHGNLIYHECCAVVIGESELKLWDGSAGSWLNPKQFHGYGQLRALKLIDASNSEQTFKWGTRSITANKWQEIA